MTFIVQQQTRATTPSAARPSLLENEEGVKHDG